MSTCVAHKSAGCKDKSVILRMTQVARSKRKLFHNRFISKISKFKNLL